MYTKVITVLACAIVVCQAVNIVSGPTGTTQKIGARFKLKCTVANKGPTDSVFWYLRPENSAITKLLTLDTTSKDPDFYELEANTFNLIVKNATYLDDGVFKCDAGNDKREARVFVYDPPETMSLDWEHSVNKPDSVKPNQEYKLKCTTTHSHPPAVHRYFKDGVELGTSEIKYTFNNDTDTDKGYADVITTLPFKPSEDDVDSMSRIRCVADLYNKKNVSSVAFGINSAHRANIGYGAALVMVLSFLLVRN